jgi:peptide deformylase
MALELKIPLVNDPIMRAVSQKVGQNVPLSDLLGQMKAAQQFLKHPCIVAKHVGVNVQVMLINTAFDRNRTTTDTVMAVLVNPVVVALWNPLVAGLESDPSIPDYQGSVERHCAVEVVSQDENFNQRKERYTDLAARWALHGMELFQGRIFIDNLNVHRQRSIKAHINRIGDVDGKRGQQKGAERPTHL